MFYYNNKPLLAEPIQILQELKSQLALAGINRFEKFIETSQHIQFNCPIHKNGQERKPSCGMTTTDIVSPDGRTTPAGTVHCFQCGYIASLSEMISNCFGYDDLGKFGEQWLAKNFLTVSVEERADIPLDLSRTSISSTKTNSYITEEELLRYRYTHPYMYKRKLTDEVIDIFDVGYDDCFKLKTKSGVEYDNLHCITFPVRDENGNCVFIARRSVDMKLFHYPESTTKPVYGMWELKQYYPNVKEVYITESMINCLTLWSWHFPAVALNGTGTPYQYKLLEKIPCRKFITALDPDEAGYKGTNKLKQYFSRKRLITSVYPPEGKDINDLTYEEFVNLPENY